MGGRGKGEGEGEGLEELLMLVKDTDLVSCRDELSTASVRAEVYVPTAGTHEEWNGRVGGDEEGLWSGVGSSECDRVELERGQTVTLAHRSHLLGATGGPCTELGGRGDG